MSFDRMTIILREHRQVDYLIQVVARNWEAQALGGHPLALTIQEETRSLQANAKLWAMLSEVSEQVVWYGQKLTTENWKDIFTAALKKSKVVPGIDGGFVICGQSTSRMSKRTFSELVELIHAFGADPAHPVVFSDPIDLEPQGRMAS